MGYANGYMSTDTCPTGYAKIAVSEKCEAAAAYFRENGYRLHFEGLHMGVPGVCYTTIGFRKAYFNNWFTKEKGFTPICENLQASATEATPAPQPEKTKATPAPQ